MAEITPVLTRHIVEGNPPHALAGTVPPAAMSPCAWL